MKYMLAFICLFIVLFVFCGKKYSPREKLIVDNILKQRHEKDSLFVAAEWSPLKEEDKKSFSGLNYFTPDLSFRFTGSITRYDSTIRDTIMGTRGDIRPALKYGYFPFHYKGHEYHLQVYKILRDDPVYQKYLFLGFTDATTGKMTYETGRYIDLSENSENYYTVDFNLAYNPYCAYNHRYTCAIPPLENQLPFAVKAGEKKFK